MKKGTKKNTGKLQQNLHPQKKRSRLNAEDSAAENKSSSPLLEDEGVEEDNLLAAEAEDNEWYEPEETGIPITGYEDE